MNRCAVRTITERQRFLMEHLEQVQTQVPYGWLQHEAAFYFRVDGTANTEAARLTVKFNMAKCAHCGAYFDPEDKDA